MAQKRRRRNKRLYYLGNTKLKAANVPQEFTTEQVTEFLKCKKDIVYFAKKYVQIVSLDRGLVNFQMWDWQVKTVRTLSSRRFTIMKVPRQSGKSITVLIYILHSIIFSPNFAVAIFANKASTATGLLKKLKLSYENLPLWLQQGVVEWAKTSLELENGSSVIAAATTESTGRSGSYNFVLLDEFAFVKNNLAEDFLKSAYPTITAGTTTKIAIVSTPHGMNHFYKMWKDAIKGWNSYAPIDVHWSEVPGRDARWKEQTIKNIGEEAFNQEYGCEFFGEGTETLISPILLKNLEYDEPFNESGLDIYQQPRPDRHYAITVDTARGNGDDRSAFIVFDVTELPYRVVAKYSNSEISPLFYPTIILAAAIKYNTAFVLVEINDIGGQVVDTLYHEMEYENIFLTRYDRRVGGDQKINFSAGKKMRLGLRMTTPVKRIGCTTLKTLIESHHLELKDFDIISELTTFVRHRSTYKAEIGSFDDLAMCLVMFGWLTNQRHFKELVGTDVRARLTKEENKYAKLQPAISYDDHHSSQPQGESVFIEDGCVWEVVGGSGPRDHFDNPMSRTASDNQFNRMTEEYLEYLEYLNKSRNNN